MTCRVIGIDPAPTKKSVEYDGTGWHSWSPADLRARVRALEAPAIIAWDAPLSFDRVNFYDRVVDKVVREWVKEKEGAGLFEEKAIGVRPFAGLVHWAVTCDALGLPFGQIPPRCALSKLPPEENSADIAVIEVHPAVALAIWWLEDTRPTPLPRYKGKTRLDAARAIADALGFPAEAGTSDDYLDAYIACRLGTQFRDGDAHWLGDPKLGGYVLPDSQFTDALRKRYATVSAGGLESRKRRRPSQ